MKSKPVKISIVSYLNAIPFKYSLEQYTSQDSFEISNDIPSVCADKLIHNQADIGLIPVAMIPMIQDAEIITSFCIAANGPVESVVLVSRVPLEKIRQVILDTESRTSVLLVKILAKGLWNIQPEWIQQQSRHHFEDIESIPAAVMIGDKALLYRSRYPYCYDLAEAWKKMTGLPFVFACWVSNKKINDNIIQELEEIFAKGTGSIDDILPGLKDKYPGTDVEDYLKQKIKYHLGEEERAALLLFLEKISTYSSADSGPVVSVKIK